MQPEYLTEEECIRLLETIAQKGRPQVRERDMAMVILFLHTGLRVSELTSLKLVNVDLDRDQIKITRKGDKEQYLHLNGETVRALVNYLANPPEAQNGSLFAGTNGGNLARAHVYGVVRRYLNLAGIDKGKHGPHLLRHTFCTRLHQKGVGPFTIKDLAGHKSLNTTMRYINIEDKEQADRKLLILTNEEMYQDFKHRSRGKIADGIELVFCKLPESMSQQLKDIGDKASKEMSR